MELKEIFTTYWSQTTLILFGIGYFIKRIFDNISNKREINHNLFQQNRLNAVNDFFSSYAKTEQMWRDLSTIQILEYKISTKEIDKTIFTPINNLRKNVLELQIYFNKNFKSILKNVYSINEKLQDIYYEYDKESSTTVKSNNFGSLRDLKLKENEIIFEQINEIVKKSFN